MFVPQAERINDRDHIPGAQQRVIFTPPSNTISRGQLILQTDPTRLSLSHVMLSLEFGG